MRFHRLQLSAICSLLCVRRLLFLLLENTMEPSKPGNWILPQIRKDPSWNTDVIHILCIYLVYENFRAGYQKITFVISLIRCINKHIFAARKVDIVQKQWSFTTSVTKKKKKQFYCFSRILLFFFLIYISCVNFKLGKNLTNVTKF